MYKLVNKNSWSFNSLSQYSENINIIVLILITLLIIYKLIHIPDVKIGLLEISNDR